MLETGHSPGLMEAGELEPVCDVCSLEPPKYTCPGCSAKSCSLLCVRKHKSDTGCNGKRSKTDFIKISSMNDEIINLDDQLLAEVHEKTKRAAQLEPKQDHKSLGRQGAFRWMLQERRLLVKCMPSDFSRHKLNKSRVFGKGENRLVKWTLEIRQEGMESKYIHDCSEQEPVSTFLPENTSQATVLNEGSRPKQVPLDLNKSLAVQLEDMTIVEHPVITIICS